MTTTVILVLILGSFVILRVACFLMRDSPYSYYEGGQKKAAGEIDKGDSDGLWRFWHRNGKLSARGRFDHGEKTGHWVYWHDNGKKLAEGEYNAKCGPYTERPDALGIIMGNAQCGHWVYWHDNGEKKAEGEFDSDGQPVGVWEFWDNTGAKIDDEPEEYRIP